VRHRLPGKKRFGRAKRQHTGAPSRLTEWIVIAIVVSILSYAATIFNRLVRARNLVREGWSSIVQLRRRTDLVPNLVEVVKGYAAHATCSRR
jgi:hypothetical protein